MTRPTVESSADGLSAIAHRLTAGADQRWAGALVQMSGTWLPPIALLPRGVTGVPAPRTEWGTESVDFDQRWVVRRRTPESPLTCSAHR